MTRFGLLATIPMFAAAFALSGCGSGDSDEPRSRVRILNAALANSGGQPVDVLLNGQRIFTNVGFGATSTRTEVDAGPVVPFTVQQAGTGVNLATGNVNVTHSVDQTLLVTGIPNGSGGLQYQVVALPPEDLSTTPTSTQSRVYFVNAATSSTAALSTASFTATPAGGTAVNVPNVNFAEMSAAQLVPSGDYTFTATVGGQTVNATATLDGRKSYTVVLAGRTTVAGGTPALQLQVIQNN